MERTKNIVEKTEKPDRWALKREKGRKVSVDGYRDKLTVHGLRSDLHARWVLDKTTSGKRVWELKKLGWDFVHPDEVEIGDEFVAKAGNLGSIIRYPANKEGEYLYLMAIPKEWHEENQRIKQARIKEEEDSMFRKRGLDEELYGAANRETRSPGGVETRVGHDIT